MTAFRPRFSPGYVTRPVGRTGRGRVRDRRAHAQPTSDRERRRGVALVVVMTVIAMLTVFVAELLQNTSTAFHVAISERDRLRAEYLAKSGINLTRLLISKERQIRQVIAPLYQMAVRRSPPQLNVWDFADALLAPFADPESAEAFGAETGIDFSLMEGIKDTGGTFTVVTVPENAKININKPLFFTGDDARRSIARQIYALLGGYQSPDSPYDPMFSARDPDGHYTNRLDIVSAMIDWWDYDEERTVFDPGSAGIAAGGSEDDIYTQLPDSYVVKNAPFDSLEELRLCRGVSDDFWATFVESDEDPRTRKVTIYGSGAVNVNLAPPDVLLARLCSFATDQLLCRDPLQAAAFIQLFNTARALVPIALFSSPGDFLDFVTGSSNKGLDLYATLLGLLGPDNPLMVWTPMTLTPEQRKEMEGRFLVEASIFTIQSTANVGRAEVRMTMVVNYDLPWTPPPGVPGKLPPLGAVHYFQLR